MHYRAQLGWTTMRMVLDAHPKPPHQFGSPHQLGRGLVGEQGAYEQADGVAAYTHTAYRRRFGMAPRVVSTPELHERLALLVVCCHRRCVCQDEHYTLALPSHWVYNPRPCVLEALVNTVGSPELHSHIVMGHRNDEGRVRHPIPAVKENLNVLLPIWSASGSCHILPASLKSRHVL